MNSEASALSVGAFVWGAFVLVGLLGRPVRLSRIVSIGGGFLAGTVVAIFAKIYFDSGLLGLVSILMVLWLVWWFLRNLPGN